jgi:hypothetical protein
MSSKGKKRGIGEIKHKNAKGQQNKRQKTDTDDEATASSEATVRSSVASSSSRSVASSSDPEDNKVKSSEVIGKKLPVLPFKPKPKEPESCIIS